MWWKKIWCVNLVFQEFFALHHYYYTIKKLRNSSTHCLDGRRIVHFFLIPEILYHYFLWLLFLKNLDCILYYSMIYNSNEVLISIFFSWKRPYIVSRERKRLPWPSIAQFLPPWKSNFFLQPSSVWLEKMGFAFYDRDDPESIIFLE